MWGKQLFLNSSHLKVSTSLHCWATLFQKIIQKHLSNYVPYFKPQELFTFISAEAPWGDWDLTALSFLSAGEWTHAKLKESKPDPEIFNPTELPCLSENFAKVRTTRLGSAPVPDLWTLLSFRIIRVQRHKGTAETSLLITRGHILKIFLLSFPAHKQANFHWHWELTA